MALRIYLLNAAGAINAASLFSSGVIDAAAIGANAVGASEIAADAVGASEVDEAASLTVTGLNATSSLQKNSVDVDPTQQLYYAVVVAATTADVPDFSNATSATVDGISLAANNDVLVWKQTAPAQNGIYNVDVVGSGSNGDWTRASERDAAAELPVGLVVYVQGGTLYGQRMFKLTSVIATLGTDAATFEETEEGMTPVGANGEPELVGTGDGSDLRFDLSSAGIIYTAVIVDGIPQLGSTYSISAGTGAAGVDELVFGSGNAPANGATIEAILFKRT